MVVMISVLVIATLLKDHSRRLSARRQLAVYGSGLQRRGILLLGTVYRAGDGAGFADKPENCAIRHGADLYPAGAGAVVGDLA